MLVRSPTSPTISSRCAPHRIAPSATSSRRPSLPLSARKRLNSHVTSPTEAHFYLVTPDHTRWAREVFGPNKLLAVEQGAVLTTDREVFRRVAYHHLEFYTGLANYRNSWARLGFADTNFVRDGSERWLMRCCAAARRKQSRDVSRNTSMPVPTSSVSKSSVRLPGSLAADDIRLLAQALF
jgi:hypothetical protein